MNKIIKIKNKELEITVLETEGNRNELEKLEMSFEEAKELIFKNNHRINHIEIKSGNPFDKKEFALATLFKSYAYFPKGMRIVKTKEKGEFTKEGDFTLIIPDKTVIFYREFDDHKKEDIEILKKYSPFFPYISNRNNIFEVMPDYPIMAHVNDKIEMCNNKITSIWVYDRETAEKMEEKKEKFEMSEEGFWVSLMHDYLGFGINKKTNSVTLEIEAVCGTIISYENGEWEKEYHGYKEEECYEFFFYVTDLLDTFQKTIKKYTDEDFSKYFDILRNEAKSRVLLNSTFNKKSNSDMQKRLDLRIEYFEEKFNI